MRAVVVQAFGPPESYRVGELPAPVPGPGQLRLRVAAAAINPGDIVMPSGAAGVPLEFPHVPGNDFAGTVTDLGPGVTGFAVGDEVFGFAPPRALRSFLTGRRPSLGTGSLAEHLVVEADTPLIAHRPAGLPAADAAALATTGLTARALLGTAGPLAGKNVLLIGATGGVGTAVLPPLAAAGARVIATGTAADADLLRELGAAEVIGYAEADYPAGVDVVVNTVLPGDRLTGAARALTPGGALLTITYPVPDQSSLGRDDVALRFVLDLDGEFGGMAEVATDAAAGRLRAVISRRYPLSDAARACVDFARAHTTGKLVVTP